MFTLMLFWSAAVLPYWEKSSEINASPERPGPVELDGVLGTVLDGAAGDDRAVDVSDCAPRLFTVTTDVRSVTSRVLL